VNWLGQHKFLSVLIAVAVLWFFSAVSGSADDQPAADDVSSEVEGTIDDNGSSLADEDKVEDEDRGDRASEPKKRKKTYVVVHVVDGDTLDLRNGRTVRLAGIDAPEVGQCGYKRARNTLAGLVLGKRVSLAASDEEQDQYGRLLKYVDVGKTDAGLRLIKSGLAIARYDSRDGYGYHPREPRYIAADRASAAFACAPKPVPFASQPKQSKNCAPGYSPCIPPYPPDLDCPDIGHPVRVSGSDPHGLDRDGDGVACEWN
jgi:endonuclease YncB( thermonuclease family)